MKVKVEYKNKRKSHTVEATHTDTWKKGKVDPKLKARAMLYKHGLSVALETAWQHYQLQEKGTVGFEFWRGVVSHLTDDASKDRKPNTKAKKRALRHEREGTR